MRNLPLFTFVNKMDSPGLSPYEIMDQIMEEFQLETFPIVWPIGDGDRFKGVLDRLTDTVHFYQKPIKRGSKAEVIQVPFSDTAQIKEIINDAELFDRLMEDYELLNELIEPLDITRVMAGTQSPMFFGSAMTNFGVQLFLDKFCDMGTKPLGRNAVTPTHPTESDPQPIDPHSDEFSGFVFKTQANLDPKHRDRLAYIRIVSGTYEKGMTVKHSRSKPSKKYNLAQAQALFGSDRQSIDVAYPGDVIGINNPGTFGIGDTLYTGSPVAFPGIPSFSPEKFAYLTSPNPSSRKAFQKGMDQLLAEGAVQSLRQRNDDGGGPLILAAVGELQFEVVQARLLNEYGVESRLEQISYTLARWADGGWESVDKANADGKLFGSMIVMDRWKRPVLLFRNDWKAAAVAVDEPYLELAPWSKPPPYDEKEKR
mmetsp:Transcript_1671/g.1984  ORF Transcript_1671/g.1984 Transcript_1671/m.1984 type:complete len:426 (+) Transcript_1671:48-1325(+)